MNTTLVMFGLFVLITLSITYWAARRTHTTRDFYAAGRQITGFQNGIAVAGDYMSAASFLGIAGLIAFFGYDGFMYSVGWLVAYLTVLLLVAEPLRNTGKYTMADVLAYRLAHPSVRSVAAVSTLVVSLFYMIAQMVGAGSLVNLLIPEISFNTAIVIVGVLMIVYVVFGGMLATTWVQIIKAVLLMAGTIVLSIMVMSRFDFSFIKFFDAVASVTGTVRDAGGNVIATKNFTQPGLRYNGTYGPLDLISLGMALIFGTAGLPHILMRFYTVPTARAARVSVVWAMVLIGCFYIMTTFLGFGAATLVGKANIGVRMSGDAAIRFIASNPDRAPQLSEQLNRLGYIVPTPNNNLAAPILAEQLGGEIFLAFIAAVAFATILAVVAGLTIAASSAFAHDLWLMVIKRGNEDEKEQVKVARVTAFVVGALAIILGNCPQESQRRIPGGAGVCGRRLGQRAGHHPLALLASIQHHGNGDRNADRPGCVINSDHSQPGGDGNRFSCGFCPPPDPGGADLSAGESWHRVDSPGISRRRPGNPALPRDRAAEARYSEVNVRANTGLGAEV